MKKCISLCLVCLILVCNFSFIAVAGDSIQPIQLNEYYSGSATYMGYETYKLMSAHESPYTFRLYSSNLDLNVRVYKEGDGNWNPTYTLYFPASQTPQTREIVLDSFKYYYFDIYPSNQIQTANYSFKVEKDLSGYKVQNLTGDIVNGKLELSWTAITDTYKFYVSVNNDSFTECNSTTYTDSRTIAPSRLYNVRVFPIVGQSIGPIETVNIFYGMYGDVNRDGMINEEDRDLIIKYRGQVGAGSAERCLDPDQAALADVNGDGEIDIMDITQMNSYLNNLITEFTAGKFLVQVNSNRPVKFYKYGDVNRDGTVTSADSSIVSQAAGKLISLDTEQRILADVNGTGTITAADSSLILQMASGIWSPMLGTYAAFYND